MRIPAMVAWTCCRACAAAKKWLLERPTPNDQEAERQGKKTEKSNFSLPHHLRASSRLGLGRAG